MIKLKLKLNQTEVFNLHNNFLKKNKKESSKIEAK